MDRQVGLDAHRSSSAMAKIDENLPLELVNVLSAAGHDAASALGQELRGATDTTLCRYPSVPPLSASPN